LQSDPAYGKNKIERQGVDDTQRIYYVVTNLYDGGLTSRRRVPVEDILKHVSPAELEVFERRMDEYEARLVAHAIRGGNISTFTAWDPMDSVRTENRPDAALSSSALAGASQGRSVSPPPSEKVRDSKTASASAPLMFRKTEVLRQQREVAPTPAAALTPTCRHMARSRKDQILGASSLIKNPPKQKHRAESTTSESSIKSTQWKRSAAFTDHEDSVASYTTASSSKKIKLVVPGTQSTAVDSQDDAHITENDAFLSRPATSISKPMPNSVKIPRGRPAKKSKSPSTTPVASKNNGKARVTVPNGVVPHAMPVGAEEVYEVESVLNDKLLNDISYYEVKWVGYDETTWEALADAPELVGEYWKKKNQGNKRTNEAVQTLLALASSSDEES